MAGLMEATTSWWFCDGTMVSDGEERGGNVLVALLDDVVVQGLRLLFCRIRHVKLLLSVSSNFEAGSIIF